MRYLRYLMDLFQDEKLAVAAYNAGENAVMRYGGVPPYPETKSYVRRVTAGYSPRQDVERKPGPPGGRAAEPTEPEYRQIERYVDAEGIWTSAPGRGHGRSARRQARAGRQAAVARCSRRE